MKNKFKIILKNNLINTYKLRSISKKKLVLILLLVVYIFSSMFMMFSDFFKNIYETFSKINLTSYYLVIIFTLSSIFSFFFTIFSSKNALFENKDNDLLFSLPVKLKTILLTRLSSLLIYNFVISLFIIIPGIYVYLIKSTITINSIFIILVLTLFSSFIPTILSSLFGYLIAFIASKSKNKNIVELISYIIFIALYMLMVYKGNKLLELFINNPKLLNTILKYVFFPIYLVYLSISKENILYMIIYILLNIGIIYLFISLLNKLYYRLITNLKIEKTNSKFNMKKIDTNLPMISLIKKEIKRYFSSAIYVFNTSFGVIMLLVLSIASLFYNSNELLSMVGNNLSINSFTMILYLLLFVIGLSCTTNSSISIERNNFWILKMIPVDTKKIFKAKKSVNLVLLIPAILLSLIIFSISGYITFKDAFYLLFISVLFSNSIANFGLICNLLFPKFDAPNDTAIVKQSVSSFMGIMVPLVFLIIYVSIISSISISQNLILILTASIIIVLTLVTSIILNTWGIDRYKELS